MSDPITQREKRAAAAITLAGLVLLGLASGVPELAPEGPVGARLAWLTLAALGVVLASYRPWGGSGLGLGAVGAALAMPVLGVVPAAWLGFVTSLGGEAGRRRVTVGLPDAPAERRGPLRILAEAAVVGLGVLAAGVVWIRIAAAAPDPVAPALGAAALYAIAANAGVLLAGEMALASARGESWFRRLGQLALPLTIESMAWSGGLLLAAVAARAGLMVAGILLGGYAVLALEAARQMRLRAAEHRRAEDLRHVSRAAERRVTGPRPIAQIAEQVRSECHNVVPFEWFELELPDGAGGRATWRGAAAGELSDEGWGGGFGPGAHPASLPGFHRRIGWEVMEHDLRVEGQALATLKLWTDARRIEPAARRLLEDLLPQMAASIEHALLGREAKQDGLTGVALRRVLEARLQGSFRRACEEGGELAVVMLDVDHFKRINDTHGHETGDRALQAVARALESRCRTQDLLCRYGGEEFTLLLEGANGARALKVAEEMRQTVEELVLEASGRRVPLALSAGVAAFPELHIKTATELLMLADAALYRAKEAGRNRSLLDLGGGRYQAADGSVLEPAKRRKAATAPQVFA